MVNFISEAFLASFKGVSLLTMERLYFEKYTKELVVITQVVGLS
jgi:hypothetical protein